MNESILPRAGVPNKTMTYLITEKGRIVGEKE